MITDDEAQRALAWLRTSARSLGIATDQARTAEHMVKIELARQMDLEASSEAARERMARASTPYLEACVLDATAAGKLAEIRALRETAILTIEVWRSEQANIRARV